MVVGDDHPLFRDGVVRALSASGSIDVVAEADDGVAALALIREHGPQVALLDYRMPGLDGAQVAAAVRRDELPTRVLLISAHDESAIVYNALQEGAAGFISKESSRSELVDAVLNCAKGRDVVAPESGRRAGRRDPASQRVRRPDAQRPRARGARLHRRRADHPRDGQGDVPGAVDGQDPRAAALREARRRATGAPRSPRRCAADCWSSRGPRVPAASSTTSPPNPSASRRCCGCR